MSETQQYIVIRLRRFDYPRIGKSLIFRWLSSTIVDAPWRRRGKMMVVLMRLTTSRNNDSFAEIDNSADIQRVTSVKVRNIAHLHRRNSFRINMVVDYFRICAAWFLVSTFSIISVRMPASSKMNVARIVPIYFLP